MNKFKHLLKNFWKVYTLKQGSLRKRLFTKSSVVFFQDDLNNSNQVIFVFSLIDDCIGFLDEFYL
jgi:predicted HAD superfamily hydrolase